MRCNTVRNKLDHLGLQELAPRMRARVEAHLSACAGCRRYLGRQERLTALLVGAPAPPPIPKGFSDRLMAAARGRQTVRRPVPGSPWRLRWPSPSASVGRKAAQAVALAGGLVLGVLMGQQTWRFAHATIPQPTIQPDPLAVYQLDSLTDAPAGSLAQSYLTLTGIPNQNGT
jgi:anti-sigma factor RsiW